MGLGACIMQQGACCKGPGGDECAEKSVTWGCGCCLKVSLHPYGFCTASDASHELVGCMHLAYSSTRDTLAQAFPPGRVARRNGAVDARRYNQYHQCHGRCCSAV